MTSSGFQTGTHTHAHSRIHHLQTGTLMHTPPPDGTCTLTHAHSCIHRLQTGTCTLTHAHSCIHHLQTGTCTLAHARSRTHHLQTGTHTHAHSHIYHLYMGTHTQVHSCTHHTERDTLSLYLLSTYPKCALTTFYPSWMNSGGQNRKQACNKVSFTCRQNAYSSGFQHLCGSLFWKHTDYKTHLP